MFICHDYSPGGRQPAWQTTVAEQRAHNIHVHDGVTEAEFVALRTARDKTLSFFMLITVQARAFASSISAWLNVPTLVGPHTGLISYEATAPLARWHSLLPSRTLALNMIAQNSAARQRSRSARRG